MLSKAPLTIEERRKIKEGLDMNLSYSCLAEHVGRYKSTVLRESKRLGDPKDYDAEKAQAHFEMKLRQKNENIKKTKQEKRKAAISDQNVSPLKHHNSR